MTSSPETPNAAGPLPSEVAKLGPRIIEVEFSIPKILETAAIGYRRAAFFMGLGCNAARREDLVDYQLDHATKLKLPPDTVNPETLMQWKDEFYRWIVARGLRDMVEHTNVFLDQVYKAISVLVDHKLDLKKFRQFQRDGLKDKIEGLKMRYSRQCYYVMCQPPSGSTFWPGRQNVGDKIHGDSATGC